MKFLTIDPGVEFGWAFFDTFQAPKPLAFGVFTPTKGKPWDIRCWIAASAIHDLINNHGPSLLCCEWPQFRDSAAGRAAAASDSLVKLSVMVGRIIQVCEEHMLPFEAVPVQKWMGQLNEKQLRKRVLEHCYTATPKSHAIDAVGIGLWKLGKL